MSETKDVFEDMVFLQIRTTQRVGGGRRVTDQNMQTIFGDDVDTEHLELNKKIWKGCPQLMALKSTIAGCVNMIRNKLATPTEYLGNGHYMIHIDRLGQAVELIEATVSVLPELVERYVAVMSDWFLVQKRKQENKGVVVEDTELHSPESVRKAFTIKYTVKEAVLPRSLSKIDARIREKIESEYKASYEQHKAINQAVLAAEFQELVNRMVDRLTPDPDGTRKRFDTRLIAGFKEYMENLPFRSLGSEDLDNLSRRASEVLGGWTADGIRNSPAFMRDELKAGFTEIGAALDKMVVAAPARRIIKIQAPADDVVVTADNPCPVG